MQVAIREAGAMRQQIVEGDRTRGFIGLIEWTSCVAQHAHLRELGCARRDRLVEREASLVEERQRGGRRDRLRHRGDAEDRIALDGQPGHQVSPPDSGDLLNRSLTPDQRRRAGEVSCLDARTECLLDLILPSHFGPFPCLSLVLYCAYKITIIFYCPWQARRKCPPDGDRRETSGSARARPCSRPRARSCGRRGTSAPRSRESPSAPA